jgi:hypothetical protein
MSIGNKFLIKCLNTLAILLAIGPALMVPILVFPLLYRPRMFIDIWDIYLIVFIIPWTLSAATWKYSRILERRGH